ncbi:MAG TPA: peptidoglycan editing factor PgeF [Ignavibacteria bacterium]|jgi:hypothetical protein
METIIKSKIFSGHTNLVHGISTRQGGEAPFFNNLSRYVGDDEARVKQNRDRFFGKLGIDQARLVHANQVHSNNVQIITEPGLYKQTDGLITNKKNLFLVVSVADCLPVMLYDTRNDVIANIHAGWRGTQKKIIKRGLETLKIEFNTKSENLIAYLGPCISRQNFEVGQEVAGMFNPEFVEERNGKFFVDILQDNVSQLKAFGVKDGQIEISGFCTFDEKEVLHSYRRDKDKSGRMFAVIGMVKGN